VSLVPDSSTLSHKSVDFTPVQYFIDRFPVLNLSASDRDAAYDQFIRYQTMSHLPEEVKVAAVNVDTDGHVTTAHDAMWHELGVMRDPSGETRFGVLSKIAKLVLVLPHSNADCKRIFSMVTKNKTQFCGSLCRRY